MVQYGDRLRGGIDVVGIGDFVTFLNNTSSYRRDLPGRAEYGDEHDPKMNAFLQRIPLARAKQFVNRCWWCKDSTIRACRPTEARRWWRPVRATAPRFGISRPKTKATASEKVTATFI
jgi:hypothetical protein